MILTNKFTVTYDMERIDRDFDVFVVDKRSSALYRANILDTPTELFHAPTTL